MLFAGYYFSKRQIFVLTILIVGLVAGSTLIQKEQIFKSKAQLPQSFEIVQNSTPQQAAPCQEEFCTTKTLDLIIKPKLNDPPGPKPAKVLKPTLRIVPIVNGNYAGWVKTNFKIDISRLSATYQQWAFEVLNTQATPKFQDHIRSKPSTILPGTRSYTSGDLIYIKTGYDSGFFKQIFIHELGHRIKGTAASRSPACNGQTIEQIETEGFITYYARNATPAQVETPACGNNDPATRSDEDFAESVSYYINRGIKELNYGSKCSTYNGSLNPFDRGDRPAHKAYMQCLLGP